MSEIDNFFADIQDESVAFDDKRKERKLIPLRKSNVRKREDDYFLISVTKDRKAIVPKDTIERLVKDGTSLRVLKDRCNTLSALGYDFDKPLMYYAIVAYNLVPEEEWQSWKTSTPLLEYELIHLNGDIDDIREDNVKLSLKDEKVWDKIKGEFKQESKSGADKEYTKRREDFLRNRFTDYPDLKVMTRVTDIVKKNKQLSEKNTKEYSEELLETIS